MLIIKSAVLTKLIQHPPSGAVNLEEESCVFIKHFSCEIPLRCRLDANNTVCLQQGRSVEDSGRAGKALHILTLTPAAAAPWVGTIVFFASQKRKLRQRERFSNLAKVNIHTFRESGLKAKVVFLWRARSNTSRKCKIRATVYQGSKCLQRTLTDPIFVRLPHPQKSHLNNSVFKKEKGWGWKNGYGFEHVLLLQRTSVSSTRISWLNNHH